MAEKAALHLERFMAFFAEGHGHDRVSAVVCRDAQGWQRSLTERDLASSLRR